MRTGFKDALRLVLTEDASTIGKAINQGDLDVLHPDFSKMQFTRQPIRWHPEGDVAKHTELVLLSAIKHTRVTIFQHQVMLRLAALFHDLGKVATFRTKEDGQPSFYGHEKVSGKQFKEVFYANDPLGDDPLNQFYKTITWLIENHMRMHIIDKMRSVKIAELVNNPFFPLLYVLAVCDEEGRFGKHTSVGLKYKTALEKAKNDLDPNLRWTQI